MIRVDASGADDFGAEPVFRQSIRMAEALWDIACRHGLGASSRNEYRRQFEAVLARYPALAGRQDGLPPAGPTWPHNGVET